jgi:hypothetical protein
MLHCKDRPQQTFSVSSRFIPALSLTPFKTGKSFVISRGLTPFRRPRLDLTDEERAERRCKQQETYRRRNGIPAKKAGPPRAHPKSGFQEYYEIWGKPPGEPLTSEEFAKREPLWNAEVLKQQEAAKCWELGKQQRKLERQDRREARGRQHFAPPPAPAAATPSVGRNQPCPCGSNRKFKKCCGP